MSVIENKWSESNATSGALETPLELSEKDMRALSRTRQFLGEEIVGVSIGKIERDGEEGIESVALVHPPRPDSKTKRKEIWSKIPLRRFGAPKVAPSESDELDEAGHRRSSHHLETVRDGANDLLSLQLETQVPIAEDILGEAGLDSWKTEGVIVDPEIMNAVLAQRQEEREMRVGEWVEFSEAAEQFE